MKLRAAVFDFGETLLSEERAWGVWADWIGVTRQELFAALGATVEGRYPHRHALELCRPELDLSRAFAERAAAGIPWGIIQAAWPEAKQANVTASNLDEAATAILHQC